MYTINDRYKGKESDKKILGQKKVNKERKVLLILEKVTLYSYLVAKLLYRVTLRDQKLD